MRRVLIAGMTGSGKTTLGRRLAPALGVEYHELDDLYYGPGMRMAPEFPSVIDQITAGEQWLFDSQGPPVDSEAPLTVRDRLWATRAPASTHLTVVRLRSPSETESWLNGVRV
jgi:Flp pilus assembly CpaF family ATPase